MKGDGSLILDEAVDSCVGLTAVILVRSCNAVVTIVEEVQWNVSTIDSRYSLSTRQSNTVRKLSFFKSASICHKWYCADKVFIICKWNVDCILSGALIRAGWNLSTRHDLLVSSLNLNVGLEVTPIKVIIDGLELVKISYIRA